ncbi:hypothetical protein BJF79_13775 [Actinomadura sp. CNU-125]|uniref:hypothetical protein n=1 Tax=Actinomadura sp. CNU-125 TaxID=1904961 RepID=UPI00095F22B2|nr:hypothetical protein [Actinomadura sp. CNU-125]OLT24406.1 hypothetical protein BJF79_13775 [Actinomadura sp. CNU-125]
MTTDTALSEAGPVAVGETTLLTEARAKSGARMRIKLIDEGQGSSGWYPAETLREAAERRVFGAGTHMFTDHPSRSEAEDRPERSVRDLAGVLTQDAFFQDGALWAEARVFAPFQELLRDQADHIGVSIRAHGTAEPGEVEGQNRMVITSLTEGISVDFVTRAGRGGAIVEVLESARDVAEARNIGSWLESRLHLAFTEMTDHMRGEGRLTRDERIALSSAIGDALNAFVTRVEAEQPQLYKRDLHDDPDEPDDDPDDREDRTSAAMAETTVPAPPAKPTKEGVSMSGDTGIQGAPQGGAPTGTREVSEADRLRGENTDLKSRLAEAELKVAQFGENARELETTKTQLDEAKRENLRLRANDAARAKALEVLAESTLPKVAHSEVVEAVTGDNVPLNDDGALDEAALVTNIRAAIEKERRYLARFAEENGIGSVRGLGSSGSADEMSEADLQAGLGDVFKSIGLPDTVADIAAKGR